MKKTPIKKISKAKLTADARLHKLIHILYEQREHGACAFCGKYCILGVEAWNMGYHHIAKRSGGRDDSPANLLGLCNGICHQRADNPNSSMTINGRIYPPFTFEEQLALAERLNNLFPTYREVV